MTDNCPKCSNKYGFAFGTCSQCGWNHLDNTYHWIKVNPDNLPSNIKDNFIKKHDDWITK